MNDISAGLVGESWRRRRYKLAERPPGAGAEVLACGRLMDLARDDKALSMRVFVMRAAGRAWAEIEAEISRWLR